MTVGNLKKKNEKKNVNNFRHDFGQFENLFDWFDHLTFNGASIQI